MTPDQTIKAGDLVMVVKPQPCCGNTTRVGEIFTVDIIAHHTSYCINCCAIRVSSFAKNNDKPWIKISRLKKIKPLGNDEMLETKQEKEECT